MYVLLLKAIQSSLIQVVVYFSIPLVMWGVGKLQKKHTLESAAKKIFLASLVIATCNVSAIIIGLYIHILYSFNQLLVVIAINTFITLVSFSVAYYYLKMEQPFSHILLNRQKANAQINLIYKSLMFVSIIFILLSYVKYHTYLSNKELIAKELMIFEANDLLIGFDLLNSILLGPIAEEAFFRGLVYGSLKSSGMLTAMVVSSIMWALVHPFDIGTYGGLVLMGLFFTYIYEKTGSLIFVIALHFLNNFSNELGILTVKLAEGSWQIAPANIYLITAILFIVIIHFAVRYLGSGSTKRSTT